MKIRYILSGIFAVAVILCSITFVRGQNDSSNASFFTAKRFISAAQTLELIAESVDIRKNLKEFTKYFSAGVGAVSNKNHQTALNNLYKARNIWPEYFGTDFLIALSFEEAGNITKAAKFYKAYLNKLSALKSGRYPISEPLIRILNKDAADNYFNSEILIKKHLEKYNIDLARIKAAFFIPGFVKIILLFLLLVSAVLAVYHTLIPRLKIRNRINNAPAGYWVCKKCGETNPDLLKECSRCAFEGKRS